MKTVKELVQSLRDKDVSLWMEDGQLAYDAPDGALTSADIEQLRANKGAISAFLQHAAQAAAPTESIPRADRSRPLSVAPAQERLWFLDHLEGAARAYQLQAALRLRGALQHDALQAALDDLVLRHEALRTSIPSVAGEPQLVVHPLARLSLRIVDVSKLPAAERNRAVQEQATQELRTPFDLSKLPLARARLVQVDSQEHALLLTLHHVIADGWSLGILMRELAQAYAARAGGRSPEFSPLPVQFADHAQWQRSWLRSQAAEREREHWKAALRGAPTLLHLATDRPRPAAQSYRGASRQLQLGASLSQGLRSLAREQNTSLFAVLYAGWSLLLSRLSGQSDILVGAPVGNRQRPELAQVCGLLVNTVVLRTRFDEDPSVAELIAQARDTVLAALEHQELPFEKVVEALAPERTLSHSPLFQTMFAMQGAAEAVSELDGVVFVPQGAPSVSLREGGLSMEETGEYTAAALDTARFDLTLALQEARGEIAGAINYATDLFDATTIERWLGYFKTLLAAMVERSTAKVSALPLLAGDERQRLLETFNDTRVEYRGVPLLHSDFEEQAAKTPLALALVYEGKELSYAALNARANKLARALRARGVGPDVLVAIYAERSIELVVGLLAVLKAGGAYVPVDPGYPRSRALEMIEDAKCRVILTQERFKGVLAVAAVEVLALDGAWNSLESHSDVNLDAMSLGLSSHNLAYVIYTSGSTGKPKGAMIEHRSVSNRLRWMNAQYPLTPRDRVLQKTPTSFDVSVWELFWPISVGATLVMARPQGHQDPGYLRACILAESISVMHFVPSMLRLFLEQELGASCASLRHIVCSGEELPRELAARVHEALPQVRLHNLYGPTEAAIDVTYWECRPEDGTERIPIGFPIANTRMYVLDASQQPVPIGVSGEIYIGGVGVGRGYHERPALTRERFLSDPYGEPGGRLYRTGDIGRWRSDGALEYLGRADQQIKIRGFRIELGEIEACLRGHAQVDDAVVVARRGGEVTRLFAYVTTRAEAPSASAVREHLLHRLPDYMVPVAITILDALPLTPSGKLDRNALPTESDSYVSAQHYVAPRDEVERRLCTIWSEVLKRERVGVDDDFFELGGDSILAIRVVWQAEQAGLRFSLEELLRSKSVAGLRRIVERGESRAVGRSGVEPFTLLTHSERASIAAEPAIVDAYPLAALQTGMYFHSELDLDRAVYHDVFSYTIERRFDAAAFARAVEALFARHPALRTSIRRGADGRLLQVVHAQVTPALNIEDLTRLAGAAQAEHLDAWLARERYARFTWETPPLLRLFVHRLDAQRFQYTVSFHHLILDGWSVATMQAELFDHYEQLMQGRDQPPAAPRALYRDFVAAEQEAEASVDSRTFWLEQLHDASLLKLPSLEPSVSAKGQRIGRHERVLPSSVSEPLVALARTLKVSLRDVLLSAYVKVLSFASGQRDVLTGVVANGRLEQEDGDRVLGLFLNTLPLRVRVGDESWRALIQSVQRQDEAMRPHRRFPLQTIQNALGGSSLFNVLFNYTHFHVYEAMYRGEAVPHSAARFFEQTNYDMMVYFSHGVGDSSLTLTVIHDEEVHDAAQVTRLVGYFERALDAMARDSGEKHDAASLLSLEEWRALTARAAFEAPAAVAGKLIHQLFEAHAARTPDATALRCGALQVSYGELNRRANQLAHYLREHGVGPEKRVVVSLDRNTELVVGILGVLKAGGAYVPVDPSYPGERTNYMVRESDPHMILTENEIADSLPETHAPVVSLDGQAAAFARYPEVNPDVALQQGNLAYVIYTSGSTGVPKGVMLDHGNAANFVQWASHAFSAEQLRHTLFATSINFDLSVFELFVPLAVGGTVHLVSNAVDLDTETARHVTLVNTVPSALSALLDAGRIGASTRTINLAGEALRRELVERCFAATEAELVCNLYGPTETTTYSTWTAMSRATGFTPDVGRPVANTQVYVLDEHRVLLPHGVTGEIYIGGEGVARGYFKQPELTDARFVRDPFSAKPGARLYRTGDVGRWRADGTLQYLGRNDHQVKVRGFRIELGEIEAQLARHPEVKQAVVTVHEDERGDRRLVAYLTAQGEAPSVESVRAHLRDVLPEYMIPSAYMNVAQFPLTPNGKIDRRALPAPTSLMQSEPSCVEPPRGPVEEVLAAAWAEVLGIEHIGRRQNFFDIGGHSLQATQVVSRLRDVFQVDIPLRSFFDAPTLVEFVDELAQLVGGMPVLKELAEAYITMSSMSEDQVRALLAGEDEQR